MFESEDVDLDKIIGNAVVELLKARKPVSLPMLLSELEKSLNQSTCQASRDQYSSAINNLIKIQKRQQGEERSEELSNIVSFMGRKGNTN